MKYAKMLGLAAVAAMALMALFGTGSASATVLCRTYVTPCPEFWVWPKGIELQISQEAGTSVTLRDTASNVISTCAETNWNALTTTRGSAMETVKAEITAMTFGGCNATTEVTTKGELEIHYAPSPNNTRGTLTLKGTKLTMLQFGATCVYGAGAGTDIGTITATGSMEHATIDLEGVLFKEEGSFLCPGTAVWEGKLEITEPARIYIKNEPI